MNGNNLFLGVVQNGQFQRLTPEPAEISKTDRSTVSPANPERAFTATMVLGGTSTSAKGYRAKISA